MENICNAKSLIINQINRDIRKTLNNIVMHHKLCFAEDPSAENKVRLNAILIYCKEIYIYQKNIPQQSEADDIQYLIEKIEFE